MENIEETMREDRKNEMPETIYAWPWSLDDQRQHWQITGSVSVSATIA